MCRLVACVSSGLWEELTELAPLDEWKSTLAAVLGHVRDLQRAQNLCSAVGDKLFEESKYQSAAISYAVARDLVKLSESYIAIHGKAESNEALQAYIEVVTAAKEVSGVQQLPKELSNFVGDYVNLLAEQGCLGVSLNYLNDLDTSDVNLAQLRDRILRSQGLTSGQQSPQHNQYSKQNRQRARTVSSSSYDAGRSAFQPVASQFQNQFAPDYNSNQPSFPPVQEASLASNEASSRPMSRTGKYHALVDPSIKNSGPGFGYNSSYAAPAYPDPYANQPQYQPYASRSATPAYGATPSTLPFNSYPTPAAPVSPPIAAANLPTGNDYTRDERYSAPGWNDPPPVRRSSKPIATPPAISESVPLMTPTPLQENSFYNPQLAAPQQTTQQFQQFEPMQPAPVQQYTPARKSTKGSLQIFESIGVTRCSGSKVVPMKFLTMIPCDSSTSS